MQSIKQIFKIGYGPSSSHTIGPVRASNMFIQRNPDADSFQVTLYGSLAATGKGHNTDSAIEKAFHPLTVKIMWEPEEELPLHPNGLLFEAFQKDKKISDWIV